MLDGVGHRDNAAHRSANQHELRQLELVHQRREITSLICILIGLGGGPGAFDMTAHVRRYHQHYHSSGDIWQGRFRAFGIQEDDHLLTVLRYIERNPVRANLLERAQDWLWSSATPLVEDDERPRPILDPGPVPRPNDWLEHVNQPQTEAEVEHLRECLRRGRPFGSLAWMSRTARRLGLEASLRPLGRPRNKPSNAAKSLFDDPTDAN